MIKAFNEFIRDYLELKENEYIIHYDRKDCITGIKGNNYRVFEEYTVYNKVTKRNRTIEKSYDVSYLTDSNEDDDEVEHSYIGQ